MIRATLIFLLTFATALAQTYILPPEALQDALSVDRDTFRARWQAQSLPQPLENGYFVVYQHEQLTYFFGPANTVEKGRANFQEMLQARQTLIARNPKFSSSKVALWEYDLEQGLQPVDHTPAPQGGEPGSGGVADLTGEISEAEAPEGTGGESGQPEAAGESGESAGESPQESTSDEGTGESGEGAPPPGSEAESQSREGSGQSGPRQQRGGPLGENPPEAGRPQGEASGAENGSPDDSQMDSASGSNTGQTGDRPGSAEGSEPDAGGGASEQVGRSASSGSSGNGRTEQAGASSSGSAPSQRDQLASLQELLGGGSDEASSNGGSTLNSSSTENAPPSQGTGTGAAAPGESGASGNSSSTARSTASNPGEANAASKSASPADANQPGPSGTGEQSPEAADDGSKPNEAPETATLPGEPVAEAEPNAEQASANPPAERPRLKLGEAISSEKAEGRPWWLWALAILFAVGAGALFLLFIQREKEMSSGKQQET